MWHSDLPCESGLGGRECEREGERKERERKKGKKKNVRARGVGQ